MAREYEKIVKTRSAKGWTRDIVLYEQFDDSLIRWETFAAGAGTVTHKTDTPYIGLGYAHLKTGATGGMYTHIEKSIEPAEPRLVEIKAWLRVPDGLGTNLTIIILTGLNHTEENIQAIPELRVIFDASGNTTVKIYTDDGVYTEIPEANADDLAIGWNPITLLVNMNTKKYEKLITTRSVVDLSGYGMATHALADVDVPRIKLDIKTDEAAAKELSIDKVTIDYPPLV